MKQFLRAAEGRVCKAPWWLQAQRVHFCSKDRQGGHEARRHESFLCVHAEYASYVYVSMREDESAKDLRHLFTSYIGP